MFLIVASHLYLLLGDAKHTLTFLLVYYASLLGCVCVSFAMDIRAQVHCLFWTMGYFVRGFICLGTIIYLALAVFWPTLTSGVFSAVVVIFSVL